MLIKIEKLCRVSAVFSFNLLPLFLYSQFLCKKTQTFNQKLEIQHLLVKLFHSFMCCFV